MISKSSLDHFIEGKCMLMCSEKEIQMRERERLLHVLEMVRGTEKDKYPKADRQRMVKQFSRSAAGKTINDYELRPANVLLETVSYLLFDVIDTDYLPWHTVYDFITDRLMAVRQDMVVQNLSIVQTITILQPIIRFHAYAAYRLCCENINHFDPVLNNKHLQECLKKILHSYDAYDNLLHNSFEDQTDTIQFIMNRQEFETLYVLFNLGNEEALRRAIGLKNKSDLLMKAIQLSLFYNNNNFVKTCRLMTKLPPLLVAVASLHLQKIRRKAFQIMSTAYNSKLLSFPLLTLREILLYDTIEELREDCKYFGLICDEDKIYFKKDSFIFKTAVNMKYHTFVEEKFLKQNLQELLLSNL